MSTIFNYSDYNLVKGQHTLGTGMFMKKNAYVPKNRNDIAHWDFLPKFLSLHYYTTLEGVLGVQRRG